MYFDINLKLLFGKNTLKVNKQNTYLGFVELGVDELNEIVDM